MKKIFLLMSLILFVSSLTAKNKVIVKITADAYKGSTNGIRVELYCNSKKEKSQKVNNNGKCDILLDFNKDYRLAIVKNGYVTKYVDVNTEVPAHILDYDSFFPPKKLKITLYPIKKDVDISLFKQPVEKIAYDKDMDDFVFDKEYAKLRKDRITNTEALLRSKTKVAPKAAKPNMALKKPKPANNLLAKKDKPQNNLITKKTEPQKNRLAEKAKDKTPKQEATKNNNIKKNKIEKNNTDKMKSASVVGMIAGMRVIEENNGEKTSSSNNVSIPELLAKVDKKYLPTENLPANSIDSLHLEDNLSSTANDSLHFNDRLITEKFGDSNDNAKDDANEQFLEHLELSEKDKRKLDSDYDKLIMRGDTAFNIGNFAIARFYYSQAKDLKTYEPYPKERLTKINHILKDAKYQRTRKKFMSIVNKADGYFQKNSYVVARFYYKRAKEIWSWEEHVNKRLREIERKIGK